MLFITSVRTMSFTYFYTLAKAKGSEVSTNTALLSPNEAKAELLVGGGASVS